MKNFKGLKGSVWYLSDVISAIVSMFTIIFLLFVGSLVVFISQVTIQGQVIGQILYEEPLADNMLTAVLDTTVNDMTVAQLLPYVVDQQAPTVNVNGKTYDVGTHVADTINFLTIRGYKLEIVNGPTIASKGTFTEHIESSAPVMAGSKSYTVRLRLRSVI